MGSDHRKGKGGGMGKYILKRLVVAAVTLVVILFVLFMLLSYQKL